MIWKLSFTGIKSRFRDYAILFSGLVVASMIFYMFLTIAINPAFISSNSGDTSMSYMTFIFGFGIILLAIITLVYLIYANSFLLSMRKHDYGMFMMLGAKSSKIGLLIFCETLITGTLAALIGIIIGFGLTALVAKLLVGNLHLQITHFQVILPAAILATLAFFIVIFLLGALRNVHKLTHTQVIDLLHEDQKPIKLGKHSFLRVIEAILGIGLLAVGYYIMGAKHTPNAVYTIVPVALVTIVLGSYFVFNSFFTGLINYLLKRKSFSYHGIRMFTLGQLKFRLHDYTRILTVISLLFALALGAITVGLNFNSVLGQVKDSSYYDAAVVTNAPQIKREVAKLDILSSATYHYKETKTSLYFDKTDFVNHPIKRSWYVENKDGTASFKVETLPTSKLDVPRSDANNAFGTLIPNGLPKTIKLQSQEQVNAVKGTSKFITFLRVKDFNKDYATLQKIGEEQVRLGAYSKDYFSTSKVFMYQSMRGLISGFEFMGFFLGIAFLTMLASTLMFKVLSSAASDKVRYKMLDKIGARQSVLKHSIAAEIGTLFLLPGILGIVDVLFGLKLFRGLLSNPYAGLWLPFLIFTVLYFIYYLITVKLYEGIVLKRD